MNSQNLSLKELFGLGYKNLTFILDNDNITVYTTDRTAGDEDGYIEVLNGLHPNEALPQALALIGEKYGIPTNIEPV